MACGVGAGPWNARRRRQTKVCCCGRQQCRLFRQQRRGIPFLVLLLLLLLLRSLLILLLLHPHREDGAQDVRGKGELLALGEQAEGMNRRGRLQFRSGGRVWESEWRCWRRWWWCVCGLGFPGRGLRGRWGLWRLPRLPGVGSVEVPHELVAGLERRAAGPACRPPVWVGSRRWLGIGRRPVLRVGRGRVHFQFEGRPGQAREEGCSATGLVKGSTVGAWKFWCASM